VLEETGFDISALVNCDEFLECRISEQLSRLYIVPGVPLDTKFQAKTRNEIKVKLALFIVACIFTALGILFFWIRVFVIFVFVIHSQEHMFFCFAAVILFVQWSARICFMTPHFELAWGQVVPLQVVLLPWSVERQITPLVAAHLPWKMASRWLCDYPVSFWNANFLLNQGNQWCCTSPCCASGL